MMTVDLGCRGTSIQVYTTFPCWVILNEDEAIQLQVRPSKRNKVARMNQTEQDPTRLTCLQGPSVCAIFLIYWDLPASLCN